MDFVPIHLNVRANENELIRFWEEFSTLTPLEAVEGSVRNVIYLWKNTIYILKFESNRNLCTWMWQSTTYSLAASLYPNSKSKSKKQSTLTHIHRTLFAAWYFSQNLCILCSTFSNRVIFPFWYPLRVHFASINCAFRSRISHTLFAPVQSMLCIH